MSCSAVIVLTSFIGVASGRTTMSARYSSPGIYLVEVIVRAAVLRAFAMRGSKLASLLVCIHWLDGRMRLGTTEVKHAGCPRYNHSPVPHSSCAKAAK